MRQRGDQVRGRRRVRRFDGGFGFKCCFFGQGGEGGSTSGSGSASGLGMDVEEETEEPRPPRKWFDFDFGFGGSRKLYCEREVGV